MVILYVGIHWGYDTVLYLPYIYMHVMISTQKTDCIRYIELDHRATQKGWVLKITINSLRDQYNSYCTEWADRWGDRQMGILTDGDTDRWGDKQIGRQRHGYGRDRHIRRKTHGRPTQAGEQTDIWIYWQTGRLKKRHTDKRINREWKNLVVRQVNV